MVMAIEFRRGKNRNPLARQRIPNPRYSVGYGYIVLPYDVDRGEYIENCYRTNLIDILTSDGEFVQDVRVDKNVLQEIEFPLGIDEAGSLVVFINEIISNHPIVIAILAKDDEYDNFVEKEFKIIKSFEENIVTIRGQGKKGNLFIHLKAPEFENGLYIDIHNSQDKGRFVIEIQGDFALYTRKASSIQSLENVNLTAEKKLVTVSKEDSELTANKFLIQNSSEYSVKKLLEDILTEISNITVQTSMGVQPIMNKVQVEELKNKVAEIFK